MSRRAYIGMVLQQLVLLAIAGCAFHLAATSGNHSLDFELQPTTR